MQRLKSLNNTGDQIIQSSKSKLKNSVTQVSESGSTVLRTVHIFHMNFKQYRSICISVSFQWIICLLVKKSLKFYYFFIWYLLKLLDFSSFHFKIRHINKSHKCFSGDPHNMQVFLFPFAFKGINIRSHWFQSRLMQYKLCSELFCLPYFFLWVFSSSSLYLHDFFT